MIFSKIDKKILLTAVIVLFLFLVFGLLIFKNTKNDLSVQNTTGGINTENKPVQTINGNTDGIKAVNGQAKIEQINNNSKTTGVIIVCQDKCGDGVCQPAGTICPDKLNCICAETKADCPQDCK